MIVEPALMLLVALFILSQVVIPAFFDKVPFFWVFRRPRNEKLLERQTERIKDLEEKEVIVDTMKVVDNLEKKLKRKAGSIDV